jgi:hypothetical protein
VTSAFGGQGRLVGMEVKQAAVTSFSRLQTRLAARLLQVPVGRSRRYPPPLSASEGFPKTEQQIAAYHTVTKHYAELVAPPPFGAHSAAFSPIYTTVRDPAAQLLGLGLGTPVAYPLRHANRSLIYSSARDAPRLSTSRA